MVSNDVHIVDAGIPLIGLHFPHIEVPGSGVHEFREQLGITRIPLPNLDRRDHVRLDTAHEMHLDPSMLLSDHAILVIDPADKARRSKARG